MSDTCTKFTHLPTHTHTHTHTDWHLLLVLLLMFAVAPELALCVPDAFARRCIQWAPLPEASQGGQGGQEWETLAAFAQALYDWCAGQQSVPLTLRYLTYLLWAEERLLPGVFKVRKIRQAAEARLAGGVEMLVLHFLRNQAPLDRDGVGYVELVRALTTSSRPSSLPAALLFPCLLLPLLDEATCPLVVGMLPSFPPAFLERYAALPDQFPHLLEQAQHFPDAW
jgi:hypothetical protein